MRGPDSAYLGVSMEKVIKASNSYFCKMHEMEVESGPGFPVQTFTLKKTFQHFLLSLANSFMASMVSNYSPEGSLAASLLVAAN